MNSTGNGVQVLNQVGLKAGAVPTDAQTLTTTSFVQQTVELRFNGTTYDRMRVPNITKNVEQAIAGVAASVNIHTPAASKKFRVHALVISADVAMKVQLKDGSTVIMTAFVGANTPATIELGDNGVLSALANNVLSIAYPAVTGNLAVFAQLNDE